MQVEGIHKTECCPVPQRDHCNAHINVIMEEALINYYKVPLYKCNVKMLNTNSGEEDQAISYEKVKKS
jgi:hypothetical protein